MSRPCVCSQELASLRQKLALRYTGTLEADFASQLDSRLETAIDELRERSEQEIAQYSIYKGVCTCISVRSDLFVNCSFLIWTIATCHSIPVCTEICYV